MKYTAWLFLLLLGGSTAFAQTSETINQLGAGTALGGTELVPMYQGANPALTTTPRAIATYVPTQFNTIDATQSSGADACAKISAAATTLYGISSLGGTIDARGFTGTQTCSTAMFASWPSSGLWTVRFGAATFVTNYPVIVPNGTHLLGLPTYYSGGNATSFEISNSFLTSVPTTPTLTPAAGGSLSAGTVYVKIAYANAVGESTPSSEASTPVSANEKVTVTSPSSATGATIYYVYAATSTGSEVLQNAGGTAIGTNYVISSVSTSSSVVPALAMPVIQLGPRYGLNPSTNYYGVEVSYVGANCVEPNSTLPTTITGLYNDNSQQGSWFEHEVTWGCQTMMDLEAAYQNSGPYLDIAESDGGALGATSICLRLGSNFGGAGALTTTIQKITCGSNSSTPQTVSIYLDAGLVNLKDLDLEDAVTGIVVDEYHGVYGSQIQNVSCGSGFTTCIAINSGASGVAFSIFGVQSEGTNTIVDSATNGLTITTGDVALYVRGGGNQVFTDAGGFGGLLNLNGVSGAGAASKYVCVDSSGNVLLSSSAC